MNKKVFEDNVILIEGQRFYAPATIARGYGVVLATVHSWIKKGWITISNLDENAEDKATRRERLIPHENLFDAEGNFLFIPPAMRRYGGIALFGMEDQSE